MATRRVRMLPSPGRANSDSAGEVSTSGSGARFSALGRGAGVSAIPRSPASWSASSASTLASMATTRSRTAGICTLVSSKRNARRMCAFSIGVWLL